MGATGTTPSELLIDINDIIRVKTLPNTITTETHSDLLDNMVRVLSAGTSTEKIYFAQIDYDGINAALPISDPIGATGTTGTTVQNARTTAPYLFTAFGHTYPNTPIGPLAFNFYDNMLFEIKETDGIDVDGLQFDSLTGLSEYLTANLTSTTANTVANRFTVRMYGKKDNSLQKISKIRGINSFFGGLRGKGSYWRKNVKVPNTTTHLLLNNAYNARFSSSYVRPDFITNFHRALYESFLTISAIGKTIDDLNRTVWFNPDPKKFYSLYTATPPITLTAAEIPKCNNNRLMYDANISSFVVSTPTQVVTSKVFLLDKDGTRVYYTADQNLKSGLRYWDTTSNTEKNVNYNNPTLYKLPLITNLGNDETPTKINPISAIRVYLLTDGANRYSFMVKPMGIDRILIDYIEDNTDAILYGLFSSNVGNRQLLVKFDDINKTNFKLGNASWNIRLDDFELLTLDKVKPKTNLIPNKYGHEMGRYSTNSFKNARFFYGYPDGRISPLSDDELYHIVNSRGCPVKRLIRKKPIN